MLKDMKSHCHLTPGQKGTKRLVEQYGEALLCVRYRYDETRGVRLKTAEIVVEEKPWQQPFCFKDDDIAPIDRMLWLPFAGVRLRGQGFDAHDQHQPAYTVSTYRLFRCRQMIRQRTAIASLYETFAPKKPEDLLNDLTSITHRNMAAG